MSLFRAIPNIGDRIAEQGHRCAGCGAVYRLSAAAERCEQRHADEKRAAAERAPVACVTSQVVAEAALAKVRALDADQRLYLSLLLDAEGLSALEPRKTEACNAVRDLVLAIGGGS